jgi:hypothetical protein
MVAENIENYNQINDSEISPRESLDAVEKAFADVDSGSPVEDKASFIVSATSLLEQIGHGATGSDDTEQLRDRIQFDRTVRTNALLQSLRLNSVQRIKNLTTQELNGAVISQLQSNGLTWSEQDQAELVEMYKAIDNEKKQERFNSYASRGLLPVGALVREGVADITSSSTPGDIGDISDMETSDESANNVRGYRLDLQSDLDTSLYGRNSFFSVALERGGEAIDKQHSLSTKELENRARNTILFVCDTAKLSLGQHGEEATVEGGVPPYDIDYILVHESLLPMVSEAFQWLPAKLVGVGLVDRHIASTERDKIAVPDFESQMKEIIASNGGEVWCHIGRVPEDTY